MRAYIGIGSNLADPLQQVKTAIDALRQLIDTQLIHVSSVYKSPPMGPADQPDYINAVAALETTLSADALLLALQHVEQEHGRVRGRHWGERTLDLDILLYGEQEINQMHLTVPHPGIASRAFVLYPLAEIAPDLMIPLFGSLTSLLAQCPQGELTKVDNLSL